MFNSILRALMQTYLLNSIAMWRSFKETNFDSSEKIVDFILAILFLAAYIAFPICTYKFLKKNNEKLPDPKFKVKYDSIYQNVDYHKERALPSTTLFLGRRIIFAFVIIFCGVSIVLQVFLADILCTLLLAYYFTVMPLISGLANAVQIFNECVVITAIWFIFNFTNFVADPLERYQLGWYFLYFIAFNVIVNVAVLIYTIGKKIYIAARSYFLERK